MHRSRRCELQQLLPFTVLKLTKNFLICYEDFIVATALTVYGIETAYSIDAVTRHKFVATALTVYGIETPNHI